MITQFCTQAQRKWDVRIPEITFAFNTARQESTGFNPGFLNFSRELEAPLPIHSEASQDTHTEVVHINAVTTDADSQTV